MKNKKRRIDFISFYDHTGWEKHFTKMAQKGWLIEQFSSFYCTYKKIEPKNLHFSVTYDPSASEFAPALSIEQQTFHDFCAHTGWVLACTWHQMQVFYNENEDPIPIETDPLQDVRMLRKASRRTYLIGVYLLLAVEIVYTVSIFSVFWQAPIFYFVHYNPLMVFEGLSLTVGSIVELFTYYLWYAKARKAAKAGLFTDTPNTTWYKKGVLVVLGILTALEILDTVSSGDLSALFTFGLFCILIAALLELVDAIRRFLKRKKAPTDVNRAVTIVSCIVLLNVMMGIVNSVTILADRSGVFRLNAELYEHQAQIGILHQDELPLRVEDLREVDSEPYLETHMSFESKLVGQLVAGQQPRPSMKGNPDFPDLEYTVTIVKVPFLYDLCKNQMYRDLDESEDDEVPEGHKNILAAQDPTPWGADEAYLLTGQDHPSPMNWYLLCYEDRIIEIRFDWTPTAEQIAIVVEKLTQ